MNKDMWFQFLYYVPLVFLALWYITIPLLLIGVGISLYTKKIKYAIWGVVVVFLISYFALPVFLKCCFKIHIP